MKVSIRKNKLKKGFSYTVFIDYGVVNGHRKREPLETFSTKKFAEDYRIKMQAQIDNNSFVYIPDITFSKAIDEWIENYVASKCEVNTKESYATINEKYLKPCLGHIPFRVISSPNGIDIINSYYKYLRFDLGKEIDKKTNKPRKNLSYSSVEHHKAQISGIFTYFVNSKKLTNNICINTTIPKTEEEKMKDIVIDDVENFEDDDLYEDDEFLTPEQAIQLLNLYMNTDMMVPVFLAALVGLRRSEIAGILKNKVDKKNCTIKINTVRVRSGNKTIFKKKNKNKKSTRLLYVPKLVIDIISLDEERQRRNKLLYGSKYVDSNFLCVNNIGEPLKVNYISSKFKEVLEKFIKEETEKAQKEGKEFTFPSVTIHKLRHFNVSLLLSLGVNITDVQDNVGHSTLTTTERYTHHYTHNKKIVAEKVDEAFDMFSKKISS